MRSALRLGGIAAVVALLLSSTGVAFADNGQQTTALLAPSGQPVGGEWQRWMNDSYMPTYRGPMVLDLAFTGACGPWTALGCTANTGFTPDVTAAVQPMPETGLWISTLGSYSTAQTLRTEHWTLLYEQGHVIDYNYLTDADRLALITLWGQQIPAGESIDAYWWKGELTPGTPPTMGEWFSADYAACSLVTHWTFQAERILMNWEGVIENYPGLLAAPAWQSSGRRWVMIGRPTPSQRRALSMQARSCSMIRSWIG